MKKSDALAVYDSILFYIEGDLREIALSKRPRHRNSFPVLLTCFAGMDALGAISAGIATDNNGDRIKSFISKYMAQVNTSYKHVCSDLYTVLRNALVHSGAMSGYFVVEAAKSYRKYHLKRVRRRGNGGMNREYVVLHTRSFAEDFIIAAKLAREDVKKAPPINSPEVLENLCRSPHSNPPYAIPPYSPVTREKPRKTHSGSTRIAATHNVPNGGTASTDTPGFHRQGSVTII